MRIRLTDGTGTVARSSRAGRLSRFLSPQQRSHSHQANLSTNQAGLGFARLDSYSCFGLLAGAFLGVFGFLADALFSKTFGFSFPGELLGQTPGLGFLSGALLGLPGVFQPDA